MWNKQSIVQPNGFLVVGRGDYCTGIRRCSSNHIHSRVYENQHNNRLYQKAFRSFAAQIEQKWMNILYSSRPQGINSMQTVRKRNKKKRKKKPNRAYRWRILQEM
jgi:hypothetical protein